MFGKKVMSSRSSKVALQFAGACLFGIVLQPGAAFAQDAAPIEGVLDWLVQILQGNIARSIAIVAVCFFGYLAMTGRLVWVMAFSIIIGISVVFGAATLVDALKQTASG
jgi:type IV secretion system protein VirB2